MIDKLVLIKGLATFELFIELNDLIDLIGLIGRFGVDVSACEFGYFDKEFHTHSNEDHYNS